MKKYHKKLFKNKKIFCTGIIAFNEDYAIPSTYKKEPCVIVPIKQCSAGFEACYIYSIIQTEFDKHKENNYDHEWFECEETESKSFEPISESYCFDQNGKQWKESIAEQKKQQAKVRCPVCSRFRRILKEVIK